jgi:hypothetical protein
MHRNLSCRIVSVMVLVTMALAALTPCGGGNTPPLPNSVSAPTPTPAPPAGSFTPTGNMTIARAWHSAHAIARWRSVDCRRPELRPLYG